MLPYPIYRAIHILHYSAICLCFCSYYFGFFYARSIILCEFSPHLHIYWPSHSSAWISRACASPMPPPPMLLIYGFGVLFMLFFFQCIYVVVVVVVLSYPNMTFALSCSHWALDSLSLKEIPLLLCSLVSYVFFFFIILYCILHWLHSHGVPWGSLTLKDCI